MHQCDQQVFLLLQGEASAFLAKPLARSEALSVLGQVLRSQVSIIPCL